MPSYPISGWRPAALAGIAIEDILESADGMREGCASFVSTREDPAAWLGAAMATLASKGRGQADHSHLPVHKQLWVVGGAAPCRKHRQGGQGHCAGGRGASGRPGIVRRRPALRLPAR